MPNRNCIASGSGLKSLCASIAFPAWVLGHDPSRRIICAKIYSIADIAGDPQFQARSMIREIDDPTYGKVLHPAPLPMLAGGLGRGSIRWPGPEVPAHNADVYGEMLGLSKAEIERLAAEGVI